MAFENQEDIKMWNYKHDEMLGKVIWPLVGILGFILELSWLYAHYRNGGFTKIGGTDLFKKWTFKECIKYSWQDRFGALQ